MNIVQNQDIHHLIKVDKIIGGMIFEGVHKLLGEFLCPHIEHGFGGELHTDLISNGLCQMGLTQAG